MERMIDAIHSSGGTVTTVGDLLVPFAGKTTNELEKLTGSFDTILTARFVILARLQGARITMAKDSVQLSLEQMIRNHQAEPVLEVATADETPDEKDNNQTERNDEDENTGDQSGASV